MSTSLPHIPSSSRLTSLIFRITGGNPSKFTLQGTNTYLLGTGPERLLIDTGEGFPIWSETIRNVLKEEQAVVKTVLLTHHHHDHTAGLKDVPREHGHVDVWRYPALPSSDMYKDMLEQSLEEWGEEIKPLEDGMTFQIPGAEGVMLRTIHTPGHTPDHCGFILEHGEAADEKHASPILFTGDAVLGHGTAVFEDLTLYISSLHKMHHSIFQIRSESGKIQIYPAHGEIIEDGSKKLQEYIAHRAQREREVNETLRQHQTKGGMLPMEIVKIIYKDYPESLHGPAEGGIRLILKKLEGEGDVVKQDERWILVDDKNHDGIKAGL